MPMFVEAQAYPPVFGGTWKRFDDSFDLGRRTHVISSKHVIRSRERMFVYVEVFADSFDVLGARRVCVYVQVIRESLCWARVGGWRAHDHFRGSVDGSVRCGG